jgi:hypothetical protein
MQVDNSKIFMKSSKRFKERLILSEPKFKKHSTALNQSLQKTFDLAPRINMEFVTYTQSVVGTSNIKRLLNG